LLETEVGRIDSSCLETGRGKVFDACAIAAPTVENAHRTRRHGPAPAEFLKHWQIVIGDAVPHANFFILEFTKMNGMEKVFSRLLFHSDRIQAARGHHNKAGLAEVLRIKNVRFR